MNKNKIITYLAIISLAFTLNVQAKEAHNIVYGNVSSVLITTADSKILESTIIGGALGMAIGNNTKSTIGGAAQQ